MSTLEFPHAADSQFKQGLLDAIAAGRAERIGRIALLGEAEWWAALRDEFLFPAIRAAAEALAEEGITDGDSYACRLNGQDLILRHGADELRLEKLSGKEFLITTTNPDAPLHSWSAAPHLSRETIRASIAEFVAYLATQTRTGVT